MSPIVSEDDHMLTVMKYIEQNPLRAKMVDKVGDYPWSSYRLNIRTKEAKIIDRADNIVFQNIGDNLATRIEEYKKLMAESIQQKQLDEIRVTTRKGGNYLSGKFQEQIMKLLPKKRKRGRPAKRKSL